MMTEEAAASSPPDPLEGTGQQGQGGKAVDPTELWYIHGKAYDLSDFVHKHPGGPLVLLNTQGRDVTALFESFHPFTDRPRKLLAKMKEVPVAPEVLKERCADTSQGNWFYLPDGTPDPFWQALKERCGKYMRENNVSRDMKWSTFLVHVSLLAIQPVLWWFGYCSAHIGYALVAACIMGVTTWIAGRLGHDGGHGAISRKYWVNYLVGHWAGLGLSNISYWQVMHNVDHHVDPGTEKDPEVYSFPNFRYRAAEPWSPIHRLQAFPIYVYLFWACTTFGLLFNQPIRMLLTGSGTRAATGRLTRRRRFSFYAVMVAHMVGFLAVMLAVPVWLNWDTADNKGVVFGLRYAVFSLYLGASGFVFGMISQMNHITADCQAAAQRNTSWATRQVETANNFCIHSGFWSLAAAGINIQIEHHLFPAISSDKLLPLCPIVEQTCKEFGVRYNRFDTFGSVLNAVHEHLRALSRPTAAPELEPV